MQPFQLFSYSGSGNAAMAEAALQLWQLSSSLAFTAQRQQQLSKLQQSSSDSHAAMQPCSHAAVQPCSLAAHIISHAALQQCSLAAQIISHAAPTISLATLQLQSTALQRYSLTAPICTQSIALCSLADQSSVMQS